MYFNSLCFRCLPSSKVGCVLPPVEWIWSGLGRLETSVIALNTFPIHKGNIACLWWFVWCPISPTVWWGWRDKGRTAISFLHVITSMHSQKRNPYYLLEFLSKLVWLRRKKYNSNVLKLKWKWDETYHQKIFQ